jgi:hypothetical protein
VVDHSAAAVKKKERGAYVNNNKPAAKLLEWLRLSLNILKIILQNDWQELTTRIVGQLRHKNAFLIPNTSD